ncbi:nitrite reductase small subunit NirD [Aestuariibius insulae]|uniref:nitrite reductase small subunit NirD n=1 Tax=Aestuariibius insulae TaxID=2058287 RepID=UPI00345EECA2
MSWIDIGALGDIPIRGARKVKTRAGCIAIFRTDETTIFATSSTCPHKGGPLEEGIVHGTSVTCPLHNWVFDLETGEAQGPDDGRIATYPAKVEEGRILIDAALLGQKAA